MKNMLSCLALILAACSNPGASANQGAVKQDTMNAAKAVDNPSVVTTDTSFTLDYLTGHFDPAKHPDFTRIDDQYADKIGLYLRKDAYEKFLEMYAAAEKEGIKLIIRSATRNFDYQKRIWENKWEGNQSLEGGENASKAYPEAKERALAILRYSSMPGTSRHHWGTDIDLNSFNNSYFDQGAGKAIYDWLQDHASEYGFCQPYTAGRPHGYNEERWHWSYLPIARQLTHLAKASLKDDNIKGFKGDEAAKAIGVVEKYVLGINAACL